MRELREYAAMRSEPWAAWSKTMEHGAILALEAAAEACDPVELVSGVARSRIRALIAEVRRAR
jgi:hypothetical protein